MRWLEETDEIKVLTMQAIAMARQDLEREAADN